MKAYTLGTAQRNSLEALLRMLSEQLDKQGEAQSILPSAPADACTET